MEAASPERTLTAVQTASATIEGKSVADREFPDLYKTLPGSSGEDYQEGLSEEVHPLVLKENVVLTSEGIEAMKELNDDSPCGIIPSMNRAYFVARNCLYLWDYTTRDIAVHEEDADIITVEFATPKPNVYKPDINHVLIVSTTKEVKVYPVSTTGPSGIKIYMTDITSPNNDIYMTQIVGTKFGRVFMLGSDKNVWELDYRNTEGWFTTKCTRKVMDHFGIMLFYTYIKETVVQIAVNDAGTTLYQLTEQSSIIVVDLGSEGNTYRQISKNKEILQEAKSSVPRSDFLDPKTFKIVSIHPTSSSESIGYDLVAITSNGCRIYFKYVQTTQPPLGRNTASNKLKMVHVRLPPTGFTPIDIINKSFYKDALMVVVKSQQPFSGQDTLISASPDLGLLANFETYRQNCLKELSNSINVSGKVVAIVEHQLSSHYQINELKLPYNTPPRQLLILTTTGLHIVVKQRPIDMLYRLLNLADRDAAALVNTFQSFFGHFGYVNTCSLCYNLITAARLDYNECYNSLTPLATVSSTMAENAKMLLDKFGQANSTLPGPAGIIDTSKHDGLALFISRVISPIWDQPLVTEHLNDDGTKFYSSTISRTQLMNIHQVLKNLSEYMPSCITAAPNFETESLKNLQVFNEYLAEALSFINYLDNIGISIVVQNLKHETQEQFKTISLKGLITSYEGRALASSLASALIGLTMEKYGSINTVIDVLVKNCGSFCGANDVLLYKACDQIFSARTALNTNQARTILTDALSTLRKIALHIPANKAVEIARDFAAQGYAAYGIQFALVCAKARDPTNSTNAFVQAGTLVNDPRAQIYETKKPFYDIVFGLLSEAFVNALLNDDNRREVLKTAFDNDDLAYQYYMYDQFIEKGFGNELIKLSPPNLETFLKRVPGSYDRQALLAQYYQKNEKYEEAANAFIYLARLPANVTMDKRIESLTSASLCAKSVTAPSKKYAMHSLLQDIGELLKLTEME